MAESNVKLIVDATQAVGPLKQTTAATQKLEQSVKKTNGQLRATTGELGRTGKAAATATGNIQRFGVAFRTTLAPIVAATGAVTFLSRSLNVLGQREADTAALLNGLRKLGEGEEALRRLQQSADALGKATLFDQEDFDRGFALLTSFQRIGVDSYERVAKAAADVAQITGQDVKSALLQLSKALEDPARRVTDLSRSGTVFTEQQKEQIKALQESGRLIEAQNLVLREIEKQYGGAAEAAGSAGYAGAVDSLGESFRDFQETLANAVQPAVIGTLGAFTNLFNVLSKIPAPASQLAIEIGLVTGGVVALTKAVQAFLGTKLAAAIGTQIALMKTFGAQIYLTAAAQGVLNAAVLAFPAGIALLALGSLIKRLYEAKTAQARYEEAVNSGSVETIKSAIAIEEETLSVERNKAAKMSLLGINAKLLKSQQRLTKLRTALAEAEKKPRKPAIDDPPENNIVPLVSDAGADISEKLLDLNRRLREQEELGDSRQVATLRLMIRRQQILESELAPRKKINELEQATHKFRQEIFALDEKIAREQNKALQDFLTTNTLFSDLRQQATDETNALKDALQGVGDILGNQLMNAIDGLINKTMTFNDVLRSTLSQVGKLLMTAGLNSLAGSDGVGILSFLGFGTKANGGPVAAGSPYMVGERGPELFVPGQDGGVMRNEDMRRLMGRSPASSGNAGTSMNFTFETTSIGGTEYVSREQLEKAMATTRRQAANDGAKRGMNMTLDRMQNSPRTRSRIGIS